MNRVELEIMYEQLVGGDVSQRVLAERTGYSLGAVNRALRRLTEEGYLDGQRRPTEKARRAAAENAPRNAVILAAGYGMRMVPINTEYPKGLLEVRGEPLIERLIRQLHEAGVSDICVVVGFMKERYEYLIDEFGVELAVNPDYAAGNNILSLRRVGDRLGDTYVLPCDIWCRDNPFRGSEFSSWYMVGEGAAEDSDVRVGRRMELLRTGGGGGRPMIGIAYLKGADGPRVRRRIESLTADEGGRRLFWEAALYDRDRLILPARTAPAGAVVELNTYEQLRELDGDSDHLQSRALAAIAEALSCDLSDITDIRVLKKGMTNRSFVFSCRGEKYIMRIPGEGTERLIDRRQEARVYEAIAGKGLCDDPVYIDPDSGYKITRFLEGVRTCDPDSVPDLERCMEKLRRFHALGLRVEYGFDLFGQLEFYESLWNGAPSIYRDYAATKEHVLSLRPFIEKNAAGPCLTHIDAVCDNFLFHRSGGREEALQLTDWEYAGMQDPHVDVAMFCVYAMYDRPRVERLIDIYFENACPARTRVKIYAYISVCGLLWSNWCEYKRSLGVEFGAYSLSQYRFAKEYYRLAKAAMEELEE